MHHHDVLPLLHAAASGIGWIAAVAVLCAYALLVSGRTTANNLGYLAVNAAGAAGLAVSMAALHAWQSVLVNGLWLLFGLAPLARALRAHRRSRRAFRAELAELVSSG